MSPRTRRVSYHRRLVNLKNVLSNPKVPTQKVTGSKSSSCYSKDDVSQLVRSGIPSGLSFLPLICVIGIPSVGFLSLNDLQNGFNTTTQPFYGVWFSKSLRLTKRFQIVQRHKG